MDLETCLEELAKAHAAGRLTEVELASRRAELLRMAESHESPRSSSEESRMDAVEEAGPEAYPTMEGDGPETLEVGAVIGPPERRFRLLHDLSGKGRVWLARSTLPAGQDNHDLAGDFRVVKIFLPVSHDPGAREPNRDERAQRADLIGLRAYLAKARARVELAAKLDHPHIAHVYGWWHGADGWPFAEMEYIDHHHGSHLIQRLREHGQNGFPWNTVLEWLGPVAAALDYARREHRFAHQHLDADTVFITDQGMAKLLGFGLATEVREPNSVLFSSGGVPRGVAPEGAGEPVTAETAFRRDVFALALLVYQLLAGQSAYEAQGPYQNTMPRPAGLTDDAWRVLRRGLAYPSELCPTDAGQFMDALEAAQRPISGSRLGGSGLKRRWALAAGLVLVAALGLYWFATRVEMSGPDQTARTGALDETRSGEVAQGSETPSSEGLAVSSQDAERETDLRAFEAAKRMDTLVAYQLYLQRCPHCGYGQEARVAVRRLENQEKINKIKDFFEKLVPTPEQEGRDDRGDEALSQLNALAALAPDDPFIAAGRQRLALAWVALARASLNQPDLTGARKWLKKAESVQPKLPELAALTRRLEEAEAVERTRQLDAEAFSIARRANTRRAYWTYLEQCATACGYRAEAEAALVRLAPANPVLRDRFNDGSQGPEMVVVPAGEFLMGSPPNEKGRYNDEQPHRVRIEKPFAIGRYEVMFYEYDRFAAAAGRVLPNDQGWGRGRRPVININWRDAVAYAGWLSQQTGNRYRLPTEAEWEYAARAGTTTSRYWGDDPDRGCAYANAADLDGKRVFVGWTVMNCRDGHIYTAPAGQYRSNDFGLYDMAGNVLEWTCSLYGKEARAPVQLCEEPVEDRQFVVRGGSWNDEPRNVRSADRHRSRPEFQDYFLGFRLVRELP